MLGKFFPVGWTIVISLNIRTPFVGKLFDRLLHVNKRIGRANIFLLSDQISHIQTGKIKYVVKIDMLVLK